MSDVMDSTIKRICGMLQSPDGMRRCAAAMVLSELAPKEAAVVTALGAALKDSNQLLTRYVLEAFETIGSRSVVPFVLPLLDASDMETKLRAASIIARAGGEMIGELRRQFEKASPQQKRLLIDILARMHSREAMQLILDTLFDPDFELVKEACQAVRRHIADATPKDRQALHKQVVKFMTSTRVKKNDRVLTSCLLLTGNIGAADAYNILLKFSTTKNLGYIRRNALIGLTGLQLTGSASVTVVKQIFKYLGETDTQIVQLVLDIIEKQPPVAALDSQWQKLLKSKHFAVRVFAARKLATVDSPANNKLMMTLLAHQDTQISEIAAGALARHKKSTKLLLDTLSRERNAEAAWRLAKILKPHSEIIDKATIKKFAALAAHDLETGNGRYEALFYFLRNINPVIVDGVLTNTGLKFKKAKKWNKAVDCLKQLINAESFDQALRFELSVCNLKQSAKDIAPSLRADDTTLRGFQPLLLDKPFKLIDRLKKEKHLDAADLFYLGFHFSEGTIEEQKFGRQLLEHVAKRWPGTKDGKAAKNKLALATTVTAPAAKN
ncbi:MAG: HEAT repeat domain-containing protein [Verrucomicrobiota bacterium]